jgi:hypothetical protein
VNALLTLPARNGVVTVWNVSRDHVTYQQLFTRLHYGLVPRAMSVFGRSTNGKEGCGHGLSMPVRDTGHLHNLPLLSPCHKTGGSVQLCLVLARLCHCVLQMERTRVRIVKCIEGYGRREVM